MAMTAAIAKFKASQWRDPSWESTIESIELLCGNHPSKSTKLCRWQLWQKHETQCWSFETAAGVEQKAPAPLIQASEEKLPSFCLRFDFLYRTVCFALPHSVRRDLVIYHIMFNYFFFFLFFFFSCICYCVGDELVFLCILYYTLTSSYLSGTTL